MQEIRRIGLPKEKTKLFLFILEKELLRMNYEDIIFEKSNQIVTIMEL